MNHSPGGDDRRSYEPPGGLRLKGTNRPALRGPQQEQPQEQEQQQGISLLLRHALIWNGWKQLAVYGSQADAAE